MYLSNTIEIHGNNFTYIINKIQVKHQKILQLALQLGKLTPAKILHKNMIMLKKTDVHVGSTSDVVNNVVNNCAPGIFEIPSINRLIITIWELHIRSIVQRKHYLMECTSPMYL